MTQLTPLFPRQPLPDLSVPTVRGGTWSLAESTAENFTMIVFYRGLHCPICSRYLGDLERKLDDFAKHGVTAVAVSSDDQERAAQAKDDWGLERLPIGYGLSLDAARSWGLYISAGRGKTSIGIEEPALFSEPGLFLVRPDRTLYWASVQTMPFARPSFAEIRAAVEKVLEINYPARGEVLDHHAAEAAE
ncbi:MAG: peroxiredoxin-like family protein [Methyloligellaceae bacterium]